MFNEIDNGLYEFTVYLHKIFPSPRDTCQLLTNTFGVQVKLTDA